MTLQRKYPEELRERAVKMVLEMRGCWRGFVPGRGPGAGAGPSAR